MFVALLKKQFMEFFSVFTMQGKQEKNGKDESKGRGILVALLLVYAVGMMGYSSWESASATCALYVAQGKNAVFFLSICAQALGFSVLLGTLMSKGMLYDAKDNEMLLSLPIPPRMLLLVRVCAQYAYLFLFTLANFVPAAVKYFLVVGVQPLAILFCVLVLLLLPLLALAVSSFLGWLTASLTLGLPKKHFLNTLLVVITAAFGILAYTLLTAYATELGMAESFSKTAQILLFPLLQASAAASGNALAMLWFLLLCIVVCGLVYWLLSATFLKIVTTEKGEEKTVYKEEKAKVASVESALLRKEANRFFKTPIYFLNGGFGAILLLVAFVALLVVAIGNFGVEFRAMLAGDFGALLIAAAIAFLVATNLLTAASVSLEGESLYLAQSLPVSAWQVLFSKLLLHVLVVGIPTLLCCIAVPFAVPMSALNVILIVLNALASVVVTAEIGLALNLKLPMLQWSSEAVAVKQSMATLAGMAAQSGVVLVPTLLWLVVGKYFSAWAYLLCAFVFFVLVGALVGVWLYKKGTKILQEL